jgi:hypothetical protein
MSKKNDRSELNVTDQRPCGGCCSSPRPQPTGGFSRRQFLQGAGAAGVAMGGLAMAAKVRAEAVEPVTAEQPFPRGIALRVKPILVFDVPTRKERNSRIFRVRKGRTHG